MELNQRDPENMDLADVVLEYEQIVSRIKELEKRREDLRNHIMDVCENKNIDVLRVGDVEVTRHKTEWKLWNVDKLEPYLKQRGLWEIVESVDRAKMTELIEEGYFDEDELKDMYDIEIRYSLYVKREEG